MLTIYRSLSPLPSQMTAFVKLWRYPCPTDPPELFHSFRGEGGVRGPGIYFDRLRLKEKVIILNLFNLMNVFFGMDELF